MNILPINTFLKVYTSVQLKSLGFSTLKKAPVKYENIDQAISILLLVGCHLAPPFLRKLSASRLDAIDVFKYWDTH